MTDTSTLREKIEALKHPWMPARNAALDDVLAILDAQTEQSDLKLSGPKVEGDAPDQTEVSSSPSATLTDNTEMVEALDVCLEWIDAVPSDTPLPAMPGFDRDWVDNIRNRAALASREAKPGPDAVAEAWQAIETAPKDGSRIDLWGINHIHYAKEGQRVVNAKWGPVRDWMGNERDDWQTGRGEDFEPTHWRPIPAPPAKGHQP